MKTSAAKQSNLSVAEKIQMVWDLWDSIAVDSESIELSSHQKKELDQRLQAYKTSSSEGSSWDQVKSKIRNQM